MDTAIMLAAIGGEGAVHGLWVAFIIVLVLGLFYWVVGQVPWLEEPWKKGLRFVILLVGFMLLINFLLSLAGYPLVKL